MALGIFTGILISSPASAWDSEEGRSAPIIHSPLSESITIKSVVSELQGQHVTITYEISNTTNHPIKTTLSTYSEPYSWQGYAADYPDLHFPELRIRVNGVASNKNTVTYAWLNGQDITQKLRMTGIDPYIVSSPEAAQPTANLRYSHAKAEPLSSAFQIRENIAIPNWLIQQNAFWKVTLAGRAVSTLVVDYDARPATREVAVNSPSFASTIYQHCGDPEKIKQLLSSDSLRNQESVRIAEYVLPLQFGNTPLPAAQFSINSMPSHPGLETLATLSCGPEDASITGAPSIQLSNAGYKSSLRILSITAQRK